MTSAAIAEKAKALTKALKAKTKGSSDEAVKLLQRADVAYHEKSRPLMPDATYDLLRKALEKASPKHPYLQSVGAEVTHGERVDLPGIMSSLDKIRPDEIAEWLELIKKQPELHGTRYVMLMPKMDGISLLLHYRKGRLHRAYTRGDGVVGRDVTVNARHMQGVPARLKSSEHYADVASGDLLVRGEAIIHRSIFAAKYAEEKNARNWVGGQLTRKPGKGNVVDPEQIERLSDCTFLGFSITKLDGKREMMPETKNAEFLALMSLGFTHVLNPQRYSEGHFRLKRAMTEGKLGRSISRVLPVYPSIMRIETLLDVKDVTPDKLREVLETNLSLIDVDQDGLVIVPLHSRWAQKKIGGDVKRPDWIKSIKLDQTEQTMLEGKIKTLTWRNTRRRLLKPTVILDKALIFNGVEVTNATGNNAACVLRNNLKPGTKVKLIRSGDVIPVIMQVKVKGKWVPVK